MPINLSLEDWHTNAPKIGKLNVERVKTLSQLLGKTFVVGDRSAGL